MNQTNFFDLSGKIALITGCAGLLGKQHAIALGNYGAKIYGADIDFAQLQARFPSISKKYGFEFIPIQLDVTKETQWEEACNRIIEREGRIDILVNNAGFTNTTSSEDFSKSADSFPLDAWNDILQVNLTGSFLGCKIVGSAMLEQGAGSIINIASLYGVVSPNHQIYRDTEISQPIAYSVSKGGVISLTKYLGTLWAKKGVRVNCLTPGGVYDGHTDPFLKRFANLNPIGRMLDKEELRGGIVFLASEASSHVVGHNLIIDGGWTSW
jgi:NAD(P)-dependent dehydrogenase (short-subunit alcohol dehydrogenase family)